MNDVSASAPGREPIRLSEIADFSLGELRVRPSLREVEQNDAREQIEPRVMQVLVALAAANGAVVSRDDLIARCWEGRIVGEAAINRSISMLREIAETSGAFTIETIPRVGYRLRHRQPANTNAIPASPHSPVRHLNSLPWRWILLGIGIVAIAAGLMGALYSNRYHEPEWTIAESRQPFISTPAEERYPAIAPDGTMIAYSAGPATGNRQIYLRLLKGGDSIQLTHDAGDASAPAWSPAGDAIAYVLAKKDHPCRIMEVSVPAGQPRQVAQCRVKEGSSLAFDPSGRALFFSDAPAPGAPGRILKLDFDSGRVSPVTRPGNAVTTDYAPSVSPDGSTLLYNRDFGWHGEQIRVRSLSDGADRLVAAFGDGDANATFSADGRTVFLSRSLDNDNSLWAYPVRGGAPWRILSTSESLKRLSAGPNGLLAMEMINRGGQLVAVTPHSDLPPKPIESEGLKTWCVDYARDGTFLATAWHSGIFGIWTSGANGALHQLLPLPDGPACAIRWSPDGSRFAYIQWRGHGFEVPVMTRSGETITRFHYAARDTGRLDWAADGKSILTSRQEKQGWRIWRTDLATADRSVPVSPYGWLNPCVHGTMLFAQKDGVAGIWRIDGTPQRVTDGPAPEGDDVYTIDGDRLIYSDTTDPDHPMFSAQNVYGGAKDRLAPLPHGQTGFTFGIDPKSGAIVYTEGTDDFDIGLLRLVQR